MAFQWRLKERPTSVASFLISRKFYNDSRNIPSPQSNSIGMNSLAYQYESINCAFEWFLLCSLLYSRYLQDLDTSEIELPGQSWGNKIFSYRLLKTAFVNSGSGIIVPVKECPRHSYVDLLFFLQWIGVLYDNFPLDPSSKNCFETKNHSATISEFSDEETFLKIEANKNKKTGSSI